MTGAAAPATAMLLAAGRGERMRPLTDTCPKPLLPVRGKPLMQYHLEALQRGGVATVVVNTAWLEHQVVDRFGLQGISTLPGQLPNQELPAVVLSREGRDFGAALDVAGGVARALPLLADAFWLAAGDIYAPDFVFAAERLAAFAASPLLAHLWLVPNPPHNPKGDFGITPEGLAVRDAPQRYTYAALGLYKKAFFAALPAGNPQGRPANMMPLWLAGMAQGAVSAQLYTGAWTDVGTPERLAALNT